MIEGYAKVAQLSLPPGAALVLASLRKNIASLETLLDDATLLENRPWRLPLPEEQDEWAQAYPKGGILLRRQLCMAALGDDEWFMGGLFISDIGIAFDTGVSPDGRVETGFLQWSDIRSVKRQGTENELLLSVMTPRTHFSELKLQLTIASDVEWIEGFVKLLSTDMEDEAAADVEDEVAALKQEALPRQDTSHGPALLTQLSRSASQVQGSKSMLMQPSKQDLLHRVLSVDSKLSGTFAEGPDGRHAVHLPVNDKPVGTQRLSGMNIANLQEQLQSEGWLTKFLKEKKQAVNISASSWADSKRAPGVMVRKATFTLPVPQDFPRAVTRLVNLPSETRVTAVFRQLKQDDDLILTVQMCSHDIPFGENFRVHETVVFKPSQEDVDVTMWVEVMWIASLPWTHGILKSIIESKTKADGLGGRIVRELGGLAQQLMALPMC